MVLQKNPILNHCKISYAFIIIIAY